MEHYSILSEIEPHTDLFVDVLFSGMGEATALFLCRAFKILDNSEASAWEISRQCDISHSGALYHLKRLTLKDYVQRKAHRSWSLGDRSKPENVKIQVNMIEKVEKKEEKPIEIVKKSENTLKDFTNVNEDQIILVL